MTVIDIECPACGDAGQVRKEGIGTYRCAACGHEFDHAEIDPAVQTDESEPAGG